MEINVFDVGGDNVLSTNISLIGEGIVWEYRNSDGSVHRFKVKGEKHSSSKVKKLASVDIEKMNSVKEFVEYAVTDSRLKQAADEILRVGGEIGTTHLDFDRKKLGKFIKWMSTDIVKE